MTYIVWWDVKPYSTHFIANDEWPQFTQPQFTGLSGLWAMLESYHKLEQKPTKCSAIAERPRCRVHYSFRQK